MGINIRNSSNYSNLKISNWHRTALGRHQTAIDLDMIEYDQTGKPLALTEYKHNNQTVIDTRDPKILTLANLATSANIPAFVVSYCLKDDPDCGFPEFSTFYAIPLNDRAKFFIQEPMWLSERSYAKLICACRNEDQNRPEHANLSAKKESNPKTPEVK
jgi:hypothetical protein